MEEQVKLGEHVSVVVRRAGEGVRLPKSKRLDLTDVVIKLLTAIVNKKKEGSSR